MTTIVTTVQTRVSLNIGFSQVPDNVLQYIKTTFQDTGKLLSVVTTLSPNNLTRTTVLTFNNNQSYQDYLADTTIIASVEVGRNHNASNGISHQRTIVDA